MRIWRFGATLLLIALAAQPCFIAMPRPLWAKKPGSESRLFAFERNGKVGFIDPSGKIVVSPVIVAAIESVGDFSNGLARVEDQGYIDETGRFVIKRHFLSPQDFSDGVALVSEKDSGAKSGLTSLAIDGNGRVLTKLPTLRMRGFSEG